MSKPTIIEKEALTLASFKSELASVKKRDTELTFRGNKTEEYLQQITTLAKTKAEELTKALRALDIPRLKDEHISKLVDLLPKSVAEAKMILSGYTVTVNEANLKKIVEAIKPYSA